MRRLWTPRWILVHLAAVVLILGFLALGWWQVNRAAGGNLLSYGYAIEWPAFAAFVLYVWIKEIRRTARSSMTGAVADNEHRDGDNHRRAPAPAPGQDPTPPTPRRPNWRTRSGPAYDDSDDADLAAYNKYLAWLNAHPHASPTEYPG